MRAIALSALFVAAPLALSAQSTPARLDVSKVAATRDSFVIMVQGQEMGYQVVAVEKTGDGLRVASDQSIMNGMMASKGEVLVGNDNNMRSMKSTGSMQGQPTGADITFADGRAKGKATVPGMGGLEEKTIDAAVPAGVPDQSLLTAIISTLPLAQGAKFSIPMFSVLSGDTSSTSVEVTGSGSVTVPAGTFEAWTLALTSGPASMTMYVDKAKARMLKMTMAAQPVEFLLAK